MDIKRALSEWSKPMCNCTPEGLNDVLKFVDELKHNMAEISIFLRMEEQYDEAVNFDLIKAITTLRGFLKGMLRSEFIKRPLELELIAKVYAKELNKEFTHYKFENIASQNFLIDGGQVDAKWHTVFLLDSVIGIFLVYCSDVVLDNRKPIEGDLAKTDAQEYAETLAKRVLPVYYRYELCKKLGLEERFKNIEKAGDRWLVIENMLNCNEKTARELFGGVYSSGKSTENQMVFDAILALLNLK